MAYKVIEYRQLVQILVIFMVVQFFGLLLATVIFNGQTYQEVTSGTIFNSPVSIVFYIGYIALVSVVLVMVFKRFNSGKLFRAFEAILIFITSFIVFSIIFALLPSYNAYGYQFAVTLVLPVICGIGLVVAKNKWPILRNTAAIISGAGVGLVFGISFSFVDALLFMGLLAIYDFVAVFITKHMIALAKVAQENNLALMVGVSELKGVPESSLSKEALKEYKQQEKAQKGKSPALKLLDSSNLVPVAARLELGTGDLAIPLMVAIAAYGVSLNFVLSFFVIFGGIFGLFMTMLILRRYRRALPAIPPLFFGILLFVGLYFLVVHFV